MTIQATLTTLILSVFLVSNTVGLPSADQTGSNGSQRFRAIGSGSPEFPRNEPSPSD